PAFPRNVRCRNMDSLHDFGYLRRMEPSSEVLSALDEVVSVLEDSCQEAQAAAADAQELRAQLALGRPLRDAGLMAVEPGLVRRVAALQHRLGTAAARL